MSEKGRVAADCRHEFEVAGNVYCVHGCSVSIERSAVSAIMQALMRGASVRLLMSPEGSQILGVTTSMDHGRTAGDS